MNVYEVHNRHMKDIIINIKNFEYQIKVLLVLLKIIKVNSDDEVINIIINTIVSDTNEFINNLESYIEDNKRIVSTAYLSDVKHIPYDKMQDMILDEVKVLKDNGEMQNVINEEIVNLILHKYMIDEMLNNSLGL